MLPKSYYVSLSNDYAMVINRMFTTNITENRYQIFRQLSSDSFWQAFEQAYAIMGLALADLVGMPAIPSWRSALDFYFGFFEGLTNGISGWNRQCPQPHDLNSIDLNTLATWGAAWTHFQAILQTGATNPTAPSPGNQQGGSLGNASQIAAACACAKSRGVTAATNAMAWMNTFIDFNYPPAQQAFYAKCGFDGS